MKSKHLLPTVLLLTELGLSACDRHPESPRGNVTAKSEGGRPTRGGIGSLASSAKAGSSTAGSAAAGSAARPQPPPSVALSRAAVLQRRLRERESVFAMGEGDAGLLVFNVPTAVQPLLRDLKTALLESIERALPASVLMTNPSTHLCRELTKEGVDCLPKDKWVDGRLELTINRAPNHPDYWIVEPCLLLSPGADCVIAVYHQDGDRFEPRIVVRNDMYTSVQGALHTMTWALSPPDPKRETYLLEMHTHPWIASRWRDFVYRAFAPGPSPDQPVLLGGATAFGDFTDGYELKPGANGFTVVFNTMGEGLDGLDKKVTHTWKRQGTRFVPLTPGVKRLPSPKAPRMPKGTGN